MNTIEEQLWNYIDGNCTADEKAEIELKLAQNQHYNTIYCELLAVNQELNQLDLEEPSMSFTRNVMEKVDLELKPVALKTKVDNRIIYGIAAFFVLSIVSIFTYVLAKSDLTIDYTLPKFHVNYDEILNPSALKAFLMVDLVLALLYIDSLVRRRKKILQKKRA